MQTQVRWQVRGIDGRPDDPPEEQVAPQRGALGSGEHVVVRAERSTEGGGAGREVGTELVDDRARDTDAPPGVGLRWPDLGAAADHGQGLGDLQRGAEEIYLADP